MALRLTLVALCFLLAICGPTSVQAGGTDINMVVSLDRSESIDEVEREAQVLGLIYSITDRRVIETIQSGYIGRIGLKVIAWSSFESREVILPWTSIANHQDAEAAAAHILAYESGDTGSPHGKLTDLGAGISAAVESLEEAPWFGRKQVINLIADGISNIGRVAMVDRDRAVAKGITINGLVQGRGAAKDVLKRYFQAPGDRRALGLRHGGERQRVLHRCHAGQDAAGNRAAERSPAALMRLASCLYRPPGR